MTCVFDGTNTGQGPWTHALLIGVGGYRNLEHPIHGLKPELALLPQLPEAWISTRELADWFIQHAADLTPPLGTLRLLASEPHTPVTYYQPPHDGTLRNLDRPTLNAVTQEYLAWDRQLGSDSGNQAVFYYCGHGFLTANTLLLLDDVSSNPNEPFVETINLDGFWRGMQSCRASKQLLFADSCQLVAHSILNQINRSAGASLAGGEIHRLHARNGLKVNASAAGGSAWAPVDEVTQFTRALVCALEGRGAEQQPDGSWAITFAGLANAVRVEIDHAIRRGAPYQTPVCQTEGNAATAFRSLRGAPQVLLELNLDPSLAILEASLKLEDSGGAVRYEPPNGFPKPTDFCWTEEVDPDTYTARAVFADRKSEYFGRDKNLKIHCLPPRRDFKLRI